jgi:hypothetical protein
LTGKKLYKFEKQRVFFLALISEQDKSIADMDGIIVNLEGVLNLNEQFKPLEESNLYYFLPECKKYVLKEFMNKEIFLPKETTIDENYREDVLRVGRELEDFLFNLNTENKELSYLLVIEGNMANTYDKTIQKDSRNGYIESFKRALAVYELWSNSNIDLRRFNTEILISGSGFNGLCRDENEDNNKRFSIQIIPKVDYQNSRIDAEILKNIR